MPQEIKRNSFKKIVAASAFTTLIGLAMMSGTTFGAHRRARAMPHPPEGATTTKILDRMRVLPGDLAPLPPFAVNSALEQSRIELGWMLFFDNRLSRDRSMSCESGRG